jgi:cellulose 1,4-beta-cellobiosidase
VQLTPGDAVIRGHIADLGYTVTIKEDVASSSADASGMSFVYISRSVTAGNVLNKFDTVAVPVITTESGLFADMRLSASEPGALAAQTTFSVSNEQSPMLPAGLSGDLVVVDAPVSVTVGAPLASADNALIVPGSPTQSGLFGYDTGAALATGTAPARRAVFFFDDSGTAAADCSATTATACHANATTWDLFGQLVDWVTNTGTGIPAPPTGLTASAGAGQINLTWSGSRGATSYRVYRGDSSGGPYAPVATVTTPSFQDSGVANAHVYYYVVTALDGAGESGVSNEASTAVGCTLPGAPTGLTAAGADGQATLSWSAVAVANSYKVKRATTSGGPYSTVASSVTTTQYVNGSLVNGTTYFYVVSSVNACGESAASAQVSATPGSVLSVNPAADAQVRDGTNAATNYGTAATLEVKSTSQANNNRVAHLRFSIASLPATITSAKVRLYGASATSAKALSLYAVSSTTWVESGTGGITWNSAPAAGAKQGGSVTVGTTSQYYDFDVASYLRSEKALGHTAVAFVVKMDAQTTETQTTFNSKEASSNKPVLVVQ